MNTVLSRKFQNAFFKAAERSEYDVKIKTTVVNGEKRGCYGFITNKKNGVTVYIDTEIGCQTGMLYRYALNDKDYTGARNNFSYDLESMVEDIRRMFTTPNEAVRELAAYGKTFIPTVI